MATSSANPNRDDRGPWTSRGVVATAIVGVVVILVVGMGFILTRGSDDPTNAAESPTNSTAQGSTRAEFTPSPIAGGENTTQIPNNVASQSVAPPNWDLGPGACAVQKDFDTSIKTNHWPKNATWHPYQNGWSVPYDQRMGPRKSNGTLTQCFDHSAVGAVFATMHQLAGLATGNTKLEVLRNRLTGPGRDRILSSGVSAGANPSQYLAAKFVAYNTGSICESDECQVSVCITAQAGDSVTKMVCFQVTQRWVDNDWKLYVGANSEGIFANVTAFLNGYIALPTY